MRICLASYQRCRTCSAYLTPQAVFFIFSLESEEGLRRFQAGELPESDQEWHRLVPESAREALGKREVERQSVLFEVFKSERDYVFDLEMVEEVCGFNGSCCGV